MLHKNYFIYTLFTLLTTFNFISSTEDPIPTQDISCSTNKQQAKDSEIQDDTNTSQSVDKKKADDFFAQFNLVPAKANAKLDTKKPIQQPGKKATKKKPQQKKRSLFEDPIKYFKKTKNYITDKLHTINKTKIKTFSLFSLLIASLYFGSKKIFSAKPVINKKLPDNKKIPAQQPLVIEQKNITPIVTPKKPSPENLFLGKIPSKQLRLLVEKSKFPEDYKNFEYSNNKHLIIGDKGSGKTSLVQEIAKQSPYAVIYDANNALNDLKRDQGCFNLSKIFNKELKNNTQNAHIIIENINQLHELAYPFIQQVFSEYAKYTADNQDANINIIFTSNKELPESVSSVLQDFTITQIKKPSQEVRLQFLQQLSKQYNCENGIDYNRFTKETQEMHMGTIKSIFNEAAIHDTLSKHSFTSHQTLQNILAKTKMTESGKTGKLVYSTTTFDDWIGTPPKTVRIFIDRIKNPESYTDKKIMHLLIYGPTGGGKTTLVKAIANEAGIPYLQYSASEIKEDKYIGGGTRFIKEVDSEAHRIGNELPEKKIIIFIDEFDSLHARSTTTSKDNPGNDENTATVNQLLFLMDGKVKKNDVEVYYVCCTNHIEVIDPALKRPGRLTPVELKSLTDKEHLSFIEKLMNNKHYPYAKDITPQWYSSKVKNKSRAEIVGILDGADTERSFSKEQEIKREHILNAITEINKNNKHEGDKALAEIMRKNLR